MGVSSCIIIITSQCIQKQLLTSSKWTLDRYVKSAAVLLQNVSMFSHIMSMIRIFLMVGFPINDLRYFFLLFREKIHLKKSSVKTSCAT